MAELTEMQKLTEAAAVRYAPKTKAFIPVREWASLMMREAMQAGREMCYLNMPCPPSEAKNNG